MLKWAVVFLLIAIVAGIFGFTGVEEASATIAKWLFGLFLVLFVAGALAILHCSDRLAQGLPGPLYPENGGLQSGEGGFLLPFSLEFSDLDRALEQAFGAVVLAALLVQAAQGAQRRRRREHEQDECSSSKDQKQNSRPNPQ